MFAVAFEVLPSESGYQRYLDIAAALWPLLGLHEYPPPQGNASCKRFASLTIEDRHIALCDFGMFERQQAPQQFPSLERKSHA